MGLQNIDELFRIDGAVYTDYDGISLPAHFGEPSAEYISAISTAALYDARLRGLIQLTGKDRASWLNNLVTNSIKDLQPGQGNYAFALNLKGRILFDMNMIVLSDAIWLDIDRRFVSKALAHFDRYLITEDVQIKDLSSEYVRFALLGPESAEIADAIGATEIQQMQPLSSTAATLAQKRRVLVRHDFAEVFGAELFIEIADAAACWQRLLEIGAPVQLRPIGHTAVEVLRIEAGIPVSVEDINEEVLPAETQQTSRAVSYTKGCYLGQEVVERMRSRGSIARHWAGFKLNDLVSAPAVIHFEGAEVGRLTSACHSLHLNAPIGVGYIKTAQGKPDTQLTIVSNPLVDATVASLPFRPKT
jgi:folate-binding protein YgfZ